LQIVGIKGERCSLEEIDRILELRKKNWVPKKEKYESGVLNIFAQHAVSPMKGGYMKQGVFGLHQNRDI